MFNQDIYENLKLIKEKIELIEVTKKEVKQIQINTSHEASLKRASADELNEFKESIINKDKSIINHLKDKISQLKLKINSIENEISQREEELSGTFINNIMKSLINLYKIPMNLTKGRGLFHIILLIVSLGVFLALDLSSAIFIYVFAILGMLGFKYIMIITSQEEVILNDDAIKKLNSHNHNLKDELSNLEQELRETTQNLNDSFLNEFKLKEDEVNEKLNFLLKKHRTEKNNQIKEKSDLILEANEIITNPSFSLIPNPDYHNMETMEIFIKLLLDQQASTVKELIEKYNHDKLTQESIQFEKERIEKEDLRKELKFKAEVKKMEEETVLQKKALEQERRRQELEFSLAQNKLMVEEENQKRELERIELESISEKKLKDRQLQLEEDKLLAQNTGNLKIKMEEYDYKIDLFKKEITLYKKEYEEAQQKNTNVFPSSKMKKAKNMISELENKVKVLENEKRNEAFK